jgi:hypothetical protein
MKTHEFADQLHPAARAGRPQPQRLGTDGIEHRCDPFPHLLRPGGEHDQRALLGRLLRPQHRCVDQHEIELPGGVDRPADAVGADGRGLQPHRAGSRRRPPDHVVHRVGVEHHRQDDVGPARRLVGRLARPRSGAGERARLGGVAVPHPHRQVRAAQRADHPRAHRSGSEHRDHRGAHAPILTARLPGGSSELRGCTRPAGSALHSRPVGSPEAQMRVHVRLPDGFAVEVEGRPVPGEAWPRRSAGGALCSDTAGFVHHALLPDRLVRPRLAPADFAAASARGETLSLSALPAEHGV